MSADQAHRVPPVPSNATRKSVPYVRDYFHPDPGYDQPGPPRRSDFSLVVIVQGFVVFVAIVMFCVLASLVEVGS